MLKIEKEKVLITTKDVKPSSKIVHVVGTFNPGATRLRNGNIVLYVRVNELLNELKDHESYFAPRSVAENSYKVIAEKFNKKQISMENSPYGVYFHDGTVRLTYISHFRKVILSKDGFSVKKIDTSPSFYGIKSDGELGVEDARITYLEDEKKYVMTYVSLSMDKNISTNLAISKDGLNWKRLGTIFREQNKDVAIFPEKINNEYAAFNRPSGDFQFSLPSIWISFSKDLIHWGEDSVEVIAKGDGWDSHKVGAGTPPIKTKHGWLEIFHGVKRVKERSLFGFIKPRYHLEYCAGAALFDLKDPRKLVSKSKTPMLMPSNEYEKKGYVNNVVFPTGAVLDDSNERLLIYSGGADTVVSVKEVKLSEIFHHMYSGKLYK